MLSEDGFVVEKAALKYPKEGTKIWTTGMGNTKEQNLSRILQEEDETDRKNFALKEMCKCMFGKSNHAFSIIYLAFLQDVVKPLFPKSAKNYKECGKKMIQELRNLLEPEPAVFLYPTFPKVAPYHRQIVFNLFNAAYLTIFNTAALPVTQCPLGLDSSGLPFGMQIVTAPEKDRLSIALTEYIEKKTGGWVQPS